MMAAMFDENDAVSFAGLRCALALAWLALVPACGDGSNDETANDSGDDTSSSESDDSGAADASGTADEDAGDSGTSGEGGDTSTDGTGEDSDSGSGTDTGDGADTGDSTDTTDGTDTGDGADTTDGTDTTTDTGDGGATDTDDRGDGTGTEDGGGTGTTDTDTTGTGSGTGTDTEDGLAYYGVNLAGAEFGEGNLPGAFGVDYIYPNAAEVEYFVGKGMNVFRLPFRWERLQPTLQQALDGPELDRIDGFVAAAKAEGAAVILDPHNYARYHGDVIGAGVVSEDDFADFWSRLAEHYVGDDSVIFGVVNEPHTMATELWVDDANAAIAAIRETGADNLVLVPGNAWTGASTWDQDWYGTPNAEAMLDIVDSGSNFAIEVHQYLDSDSSGTSETCVSSTIGSERVAGFTQWLRTHGLRGFLGEFGVAANDTCLQAMDDLLDALEEGDDVWLGWTYWAAGPWWGNYFMSLEPIGGPENGTDQPQMDAIEPHLP